MNTFFAKIATWFPQALETFFIPEPQRRTRGLTAAWILAIYVLGGLWFGYFFNWGDHSLFFQDWALITGPRLQFLRDAAKSGQLPLHISDPSTMHGATTRYLSVPDTLISPQYLLMMRTSVQRFQLLNVLLLYSLGYAGLLLLARRLRLSLFTFALLAFLYNFNGNLLAHLAVGHATWVGYFLFSWFILLIYQLIDGDASWRWCLELSVLMLVIWLQGAFHQYLWLLFFLALVGIFVPGKLRLVLRAGIFVLLISAIRILPAILLYGRYNAEYISGFLSLGDLWADMVTIIGPNHYPYSPPLLEGIGAWEVNTFIGLLGALWMLYFGVFRGLFSKVSPTRRLMLPLSALLLLSMGWFFGYLRVLPIPLLQGERVGTRIVSVVLAFLLVIAAEQCQRWLDGPARELAAERPFIQVGLFIGLAQTIMELWINAYDWKVSSGEKIFDWVYYEMDRWKVQNNWNDRIYLWLILGGLAISLLTAAGLGWAAWSESRRAQRSAAKTE